MTETKAFRMGNTEGYAEGDLDELNRRFVAAGGPEIESEHERKHLAETLLRNFDSEQSETETRPEDPTTKTILPVIHMNGTSKEELLEQRLDAVRALREVRARLATMHPNGRDYYPVDGLYQKAVEQHQRRAQVVVDLMREIEEEAALVDRGGYSEARR